LLDVASMNFAFLRPRSSEERRLAYSQAELAVEYILHRWGSGGLRELLRAYGDGLSTTDAMHRALGASLDEFNDGYRRYIEQIIAEIPRLADVSDETGEPAHSDNPATMLQQAATHLAAGRYEEAARLYRRGHELDHTRPDWLRGLANTYMAAENTDRLREVLEELARRNPHDLDARRELFQMAQRRRDWPATARWAREAMEIDVQDAAAHRALGEAMVALRQYETGVEHFQIAIRLDPTEPHTRFALADAWLQTGRTAKARQALHELLDLAPDYPGAELLLEGIEQ
jgi:Flp pilus assembly protein TadD